MILKGFDLIWSAQVWQPECNQEVSNWFTAVPQWWEMDGQLANVPTDSLIEMFFTIITGELGKTATAGTAIHQIQRELKRRGEDQYWSFCTVH